MTTKIATAKKDHLQSLTNLAILFAAASKGDQLDPAQQFALIRARVLTY